jgi:hypothetical protein
MKVTGIIFIIIAALYLLSLLFGAEDFYYEMGIYARFDTLGYIFLITNFIFMGYLGIIAVKNCENPDKAKEVRNYCGWFAFDCAVTYFYFYDFGMGIANLIIIGIPILVCFLGAKKNVDTLNAG